MLGTIDAQEEKLKLDQAFKRAGEGERPRYSLFLMPEKAKGAPHLVRGPLIDEGVGAGWRIAVMAHGNKHPGGWCEYVGDAVERPDWAQEPLTIKQTTALRRPK